MKKNLVCAGGGMRGIGIVGALSALERDGISWHRVAGTSSGAMIAALVASGYSSREIKEMIIDFNFLKFKDKGGFSRIPLIGNAFGLVKHKGIYSGKKIEEWMEQRLQEKGVRVFGDIEEDKLKIIATDITAKKTMIMPDCLEEYGIDGKGFSIAKAVRMSISIPFFFKPVIIKAPDGEHYVVDGGISENFKIDIFDSFEEGIDTIGVDYDYKENYSIRQNNTLSYVLDIADSLTIDRVKPSRMLKNKDRVILIPCEDLPITKFELSKERIIKLYRDGYREGRKFIKRELIR